VHENTDRTPERNSSPLRPVKPPHAHRNRKLVSQAIRVGDRTQVTSVTRCSLRGLMGQGAARGSAQFPQALPDQPIRGLTSQNTSSR
jgi:hypothetical protein